LVRLAALDVPVIFPVIDSVRLNAPRVKGRVPKATSPVPEREPMLIPDADVPLMVTPVPAVLLMIFMPTAAVAAVAAFVLKTTEPALPVGLVITDVPPNAVVANVIAPEFEIAEEPAVVPALKVSAAPALFVIEDVLAVDVPEKVRVPLLVMPAPPDVAAPEKAVVPLFVSVLAPERVAPETANVAPPLTLTGPLKDPVDPSVSVPALTVVSPVNVLAPERVKFPVPTFVSLPPEPPSERIPEKVVVPLFPPVVNLNAPKLTLPAPANEPIVLSAPLRS